MGNRRLHSTVSWRTFLAGERKTVGLGRMHCLGAAGPIPALRLTIPARSAGRRVSTAALSLGKIYEASVYKFVYTSQEKVNVYIYE
jgi:hypothetical protein